jgi:predicted TIM-barrel fold metal-dependent hydrolase
LEIGGGTVSIDFRCFDADNHYYEATDAFTRHIDPAMRKRCMQWAEIDGKTRLLVGEKVNRFIPKPTFDPVARPGSLDEYFRGRNPGAKDMKSMFGALEPIDPAYRVPDARLARMDEQGLDGCFLFPTLGVGMEAALDHDPEAVVAAFRAFNRWLEEDWGFNYRDRIFAAPMISFVDVDAAVAEVEYAIAHDARVVCFKSGPVFAGRESWSPADPRFDPIWARVHEAGVTVAIHSGDAGYSRVVSMWEASREFEAFRLTPLTGILTGDRVPLDTYAALVCHGVFDRFPSLRIASIESGSSWVPLLAKKLRKAYRQMPMAFQRDPVESFREHVWVAPFYEDNLVKLKEVLGVEHILFGSDWPHAEGLAEPRSFADDLRRFDYTEDEIHAVMANNGRALAQRRELVPT